MMRRYKNKAKWKQSISRALSGKKRKRSGKRDYDPEATARLNTLYKNAGDLALGAAGVGVVAGVGLGLTNSQFRNKVGVAANKTVAEPLGRAAGYFGTAFKRGHIEGSGLYGQQVAAEAKGATVGSFKKGYKSVGGPSIPEIKQAVKNRAEKDIKLIVEAPKKVFEKGKKRLKAKAEQDVAARKKALRRLDVVGRAKNDYSLGRNVTLTEEIENPAYNSGNVFRELGRARKNPVQKAKNDINLVRKALGFSRAGQDFWLKFEQHRHPEPIQFARKRKHSAATKKKISNSLKQRYAQDKTPLDNLEKGVKIGSQALLASQRFANMRLANKKLKQDITLGEARRWTSVGSQLANSGAAWGRVANTAKQGIFNRKLALKTLKAKKSFYQGIGMNAAVRAAKARAQGYTI